MATCAIPWRSRRKSFSERKCGTSLKLTSCRARCSRMGTIASKPDHSTEWVLPLRTAPSSDFFHLHIHPWYRIIKLESTLLEFVAFKNERVGFSCGGHSAILQIMISRVQKTVKQFTAELILADNQLSITLRSSAQDYLLTVDIQNDKLPASFINIFDSVADLFNFIKDVPAGSLDLTANLLKVTVKAGIRMRQVPIELMRAPITRQDILERRLDKMQTGLKATLTTAALQKETQRLFQEFAKKSLKPLTDEFRRLNERVIMLEKQLNETKTKPSSLFGYLPFDKNNNSAPVPKNNKSSPLEFVSKGCIADSGDKLTRADSAVVQVGQQSGALEVQGQANGMRKSKNFVFEIDTNNRFLSEFFVISNNQVMRKIENEQIYMFCSTSPIPPTDRHSITFKINRISEGLMWVGLLVEEKKQEQYIGEEAGIMQFNLDGSRVLIEGKGHEIKIPEFKDGQTLSMEVEIPTRKLRFYRNGKPNPLVKLNIPESLANAKLYPYVQMIGEGDNITFL